MKPDLKKVKKHFRNALAEIEKVEPEEVDYKKPENWIPRFSIINIGDSYSLYLGDNKRFSYLRGQIVQISDPDEFEFVRNLPDPAELK